MKKMMTVASVLVLSLVSTVGFAKGEAPTKSGKAYSRPYGMAGCGLGSIVVGKRGGQVTAATTNGTGSQLFALTSGTSNCTDGPMNEVAMNMDKFIVANRSALTADIAKGDGETLTALNQVMGCAVSSKEVGGVLKSNYNEIFVDETQAPNEITDGIISVIQNHSDIAAQCTHLS